MLRLLLILLQISLLVVIFLLLRHNTGTTTLQVLDLNISLHTSLLLVFFLFFGLVIYWLTSLWYTVAHIFERRRHRHSLERWQKTFDYLLKAEVATLKGLDQIPHLEKSAELGGYHPYIQFLTAKSHLDKGDLQKAEAGFSKLLEKKETKLPSLYGLITLAKTSGKTALVFEHSLRALKITPSSSLIHRELLEVCLQNPDLTDRFSKEVLPIFERHHMSKNKNIQPLYTAWLMLQSRQQEASSDLINSGNKKAIALANKAFNISRNDPLAFERLINSLTAQGLTAQSTAKDMKKAGKLMLKYWHQFGSLGIGRTYRDVVLKEKPGHKKIQAIRALLKKGSNAESSIIATCQVLLAETLIEHGILGEASVILEKLDKTDSPSHREIRIQLRDKVEHHHKISRICNKSAKILGK